MHTYTHTTHTLHTHHTHTHTHTPHTHTHHTLLLTTHTHSHTLTNTHTHPKKFSITSSSEHPSCIVTVIVKVNAFVTKQQETLWCICCNICNARIEFIKNEYHFFCRWCFTKEAKLFQLPLCFSSSAQMKLGRIERCGTKKEKGIEHVEGLGRAIQCPLSRT